SHHRRVIAATPQQLLVRAGLHNMVAPQPRAMCASGARYLVVHLHIAREEDRVAGPAFPPPVPMDRPSRREYRAMGEGLARRLEGLWGEPLYADEAIEAWDLQRACGGVKPLSAIIRTPSP
ncbi:MAG TPA: hypothetical protein VOA87_05105, partial [Thermoanaerobaculia bacterium]|nr:hypothetical protein [Thermoanaerobaculia bacterium]